MSVSWALTWLLSRLTHTPGRIVYILHFPTENRLQRFPNENKELNLHAIATIDTWTIQKTKEISEINSTSCEIFVWLSQLARILCQPEWNLSLLLLHSHQLSDDRRMRKKPSKWTYQQIRKKTETRGWSACSDASKLIFFGGNEPIWNVAVQLMHVINNDDVCLACCDVYFFPRTMFYNQLR